MTLKSVLRDKQFFIFVIIFLIFLIGAFIGNIWSSYYGSYLVVGQGLVNENDPIYNTYYTPCSDCLYLMIRDCNKTTIYFFENINQTDPRFNEEVPVDIYFENSGNGYKFIKNIYVRKKLNNYC